MKLDGLLPKELLIAAGYTERCPDGHWNELWRERRWFNFQAPDSSILEIITANEYARITLMSDGTFRFARYVSTDYPTRPKTDFFIDPFRQDLRTFDEIVSFVGSLATRTNEQREAA